MDALFELCDLICQNPVQFSDKLAWICGRCPPPDAFLGQSPRVTRSQLNAVLAVALFVSKCPNYDESRPKLVVFEFLRSIPVSFNLSFWPQSFSVTAVGSFYRDFLSYVCKASEVSAEISSDIEGLMGYIVISAFSNTNGDVGIVRAFLNALSKHFPPVLPSDANKLVTILLDSYDVPFPNSPIELPDGSSSQSSPLSSSSGTNSRLVDDATSKGSGMNGSSTAWKNSVDLLGTAVGANDGGQASSQRLVASFEKESVDNLDKQETAFKLIGHILDKVQIDQKLLEQVRGIAKEQIQSMLAFLKIQKCDWSEPKSSLKVRINTKLSVYQASARLQVKSLTSIDSDGKSSKRLLHGTLALLIEAAEACLFSVWRKLRVCEELFSSLLAGISQIAVTRGGQLLRVLLIRFKPLVLTICAQADTWGSNHGAMFESVLKTSCEIIEFGWSKDRSPVDTFIMGLATSIRERNDYEEEAGRERQAVPTVKLNVIRLLADLNVSVNKSEVIDTILPLFIDSLEEGDASPGLLHLRLLDTVSRMASLGSEKSYREAAVLMKRSYLSKLSSVGSAESKTMAPEATTEWVETLPSGFPTIASGLTNTKLRLDSRNRLLSLCSDVGLPAESRSGSSGADFLGPLLPSVAEICSDFDPTVDVEPSHLNLFRNLWFYIALFGLAPPIQTSQAPTKSVSTSLNSGGSVGSVALQAVAEPYMWNTEWSSAVQRISQGTPPLG